MTTITETAASAVTPEEAARALWAAFDREELPGLALYSGRMMFGKTCLSLPTDSLTDGYARVVTAFGARVGAFLIENSMSDSLGRGVVIYWRWLNRPEPEQGR